MRKILLTGATGFLGRHLLQRLLKTDAEILCVIRESSFFEIASGNKVNTLVYTEQDCMSFQKAVHIFNPDITIHLAAFSQVADDLSKIPELISSNILFGTVLLESLSGTNCKAFINTGTSWQHSYENGDLNLYSVSKTAFESFLWYYHQKYQISVITLQLFDTYGPDDTRSKIINLILNAIRTNKTLGISPAEQELDLVYIDDVVEAYLIVSDQLLSSSAPVFESYGIGTGNPVKLIDIILLWEGILGRKIPVVPGARDYRDREVMFTWKDFNRLDGWVPATSLTEGLRKLTGTI